MYDSKDQLDQMNGRISHDDIRMVDNVVRTFSSSKWNSKTTTVWELCSQYLVIIVKGINWVRHFLGEIYLCYSEKFDSTHDIWRNYSEQGRT